MNPTESIKSLDDDEKMTLRNSEGHSGQRGGAQMLNVISEAGLYTLLLRSNKEEAKPFRRWVTHEVLPTLRKTGSYTIERPPLTPDEFQGLEQSILSEGCRDAIITWNNIIVDGHNRYRICKAHNLPFRKKAITFASRDEARLWMLRNQLSRRNLNDFQRVEMVRKCEDAVKSEAGKRQKSTRFGGVGKITPTGGKSDTRENLPKGRATDELGDMAGVSRKTYEHATEIIDKAPEAVTNAVRNNELSINAGYEVTRMDAEKQAEISERIEQGEKPSTVISDVKKKRDNLDYWHNALKHAEKDAEKGKDIESIIGIVNQIMAVLKKKKKK